ncbi:LuxR family transcriptional regulator [Bradyrhizobium sp. Tv2a-2]|uniref:LuxR family transcriptional regulator n=1 Tax=Bradyrhizobium sp. Tv2a-2 TaxID=113395 RepID=UPI0004232D73|nr:LuxR family transcriptional regulator [Bradyrhizobium sp. Tv2a-2]
MQGIESIWGRRALDFVDAIEASATSASVISQFEKTIGDLGFHAYIMAGIPEPGQTLAQVTVANGWPAQWFELYNRENLSAVDPVPRHCFNTLNPFEWKDVPYDHERNAAAHDVMTRARDFRFHEGFCIPIHYDDATGAVSMAGERPYLDPETKSALHLMSVFTHGRLRALARSAPPVAPAQSRRLSETEAEVLRWAARGKTAWETSQILGISERNVRWHLEEAQRKLKAPNKTATVARVLVNREIVI